MHLGEIVTPAQARGYKVGDKFRVKRDHTFRLDSIVTLYEDDGSKYPLFAGEGSYHRCCEGEPGAYEDLDEVELIVEEPLVEHYVDVYRGLYMGSLAVALASLQNICHTASKDAGWWTDLTTGEPLDPIKLGPEKIALMHSELSEALEGLRKGQMDDKLSHRPMAEVELADCIIRALDWAGAMGYDVGGAIVEKMEFNANRPDHKIANRLKDDGKKF